MQPYCRSSSGPLAAFPPATVVLGATEMPPLALAALLTLPFFADQFPYLVVLGIDVLIAILFAASVYMLLGGELKEVCMGFFLLTHDTFEVALIPTTLEKTLLGDRDPGWRFNFEADVLAKGVVHTLQRMHGAGERIA